MQVISSRSAVFLGNFWSTFTWAIIEERFKVSGTHTYSRTGTDRQTDFPTAHTDSLKRTRTPTHSVRSLSHSCSLPLSLSLSLSHTHVPVTGRLSRENQQLFAGTAARKRPSVCAFAHVAFSVKPVKPDEQRTAASNRRWHGILSKEPNPTGSRQSDFIGLCGQHTVARRHTDMSFHAGK